MEDRAIILMGSNRDMDWAQEIAKHLKALKVKYEFRVASAHKTPEKVLSILKEYEGYPVVYITVAGRSNALSAFVDANTSKPVIACPPYSEKFAGVDVFSSLRVPSGVGLTVTIEPESAALMAAKIFALKNETMAENVRDYQLSKKLEVEKADEDARKIVE